MPAHKNGPGAAGTAHRASESDNPNRKQDFGMKTTNNHRPPTSGVSAISQAFAAELSLLLHLAGLDLAAAAAHLRRPVEWVRVRLAGEAEMEVHVVISLAGLLGIQASEVWRRVERRLKAAVDSGDELALLEVVDQPIDYLPVTDAEREAHEAAVNDGRACCNCGHIWAIGEASRPAGVSPHGQLFRCAPACAAVAR